MTIKKEFKDLGVIRANPSEYVARYGSTLKAARELPPFVLEIKPPAGVILAADQQYNTFYELEGDVQALRLVDLDREGLAEYRQFVSRLGTGAPPPLQTSTHSIEQTVPVSHASVATDIQYSNSLAGIFFYIDCRLLLKINFYLTITKYLLVVFSLLRLDYNRLFSRDKKSRIR